MRASRVLLFSILATAVFYVGSFVALGESLPTVEWSGQEIVDWFSENGLRARIYAWTGAFVSIGLAIFAGQVAALLPRANAYVFFAGALGGVITVQVQAWIWAGLALRPEGLDPAVARTIFDIASFWGPLFNASTATMAAAFGVLGLGPAPLIPRWLTLISAVFFAEQVIETVTVFGQTGFIAPGGTMNVYLGGVLGFVWVGSVVHWAMGCMDAGDPAAAG